jgi:phosphoribosylaminoimidazole-succinocarboxamide synthase
MMMVYSGTNGLDALSQLFPLQIAMPTTMSAPLLETNIPRWPVRRGKVRDIYDLGDRLLLVSSDRISAFDWVLPTGIPDKGRVLTQISAFWFDHLGETNHMLSIDTADFGLPAGVDPEPLAGRSMLVRKTEVVPIECVVRGYLSGSGWKEYKQSGTVCGIKLPAGLRESDELPEPIFTPATKEETGHDINISFERMVELIGHDTADELRRRSLDIYRRGADLARQRGIIIADTKFEWGRVDGKLILIDEVLTPDSSRFWPADQFQPGHGQPSFDKQFVRDWLETTSWDKNSPPPPLPDDVVTRTREKYIEAYQQLTGKKFGW